jgi:protein O-mannosyl-transferase
MSEFAKRNVIVFVYFALILSTLLVFAAVRNSDFARYDDNDYVCENPHVLSGLTQDSIIWAFTTNCSANWHPLTWLSHMLDCQLFGKNPGRMRLMNLFLHLANTLLLFAILKKMTTALWPSAFVAAAFALHPMHVESVAWIAERKDVLSTLFLLLTLAAYVSYVRRRGLIRYVLTLLLFALGLLAKPMLVTLPFLLLLLDYWPLNRFSIADCRLSIDISKNRKSLKLLIEKIPFLVLAAVSSVITFLAQRSSGAMAGIDILPLKDRIANAFLSYARYTGKLFWPQNLAVFYPFDANSFAFWQVAMCVLLLIMIFILVIRFGRNRKYLPVGWFWFVGTLVPVIGLVQVGGQAYADRYTYIPYIGLFIMLAWGLPELLLRWRYRKIALGMAATLALSASGIAANAQVSYWNNSITLFSHAIEVTHNNAVAHNNLGNAYLDLGRYQHAIESYKQAIKIRPDYAEAHYNLGCACVKLGRYQDAIEAYEQAIRIKPDFAEAHCGLGAAYGNLGRYKEALNAYKQAVRIKPDFVKAHSGLGMACVKLGYYQDAVEAYKQVIRIKPDLMEAYINLGAAYRNLGRYQEAIETYQEALRIKPDFADAYVTMGVTYDKLGRIQDAIESWKQALRIKPDFAEVYSNLGAAFYKLGRYQEAIESFKQAVRIKPNYVDAHSNLGIVYLAAGDKDSALEEYKILKTLGAKQADQLYNLIYK